MSVIVELKNVHKRFGQVQVLKGVNLSVAHGEVVAVIGRSGSGKSTALRCIDALESIDEGEIEVCGHRVHDPRLDRRQLRRDVGIVFQSYNLFPHLTVAENISLAPMQVRIMARQEALALTRDVLQRVGLLDKADHYPEQLSGGQSQRAAIARSLAMQPQLMLFDEVTSALDPQLTGEVLEVMRSLAQGGMTMILVTHEMAFARQVASKMVFMHEGRVWESGPASLLDSPRTPELQAFIGNGL
jgi:polar amino acid transport system ATP-binding protein